MPNYAKFMKDILSKKRKFSDHEKIQLTEECNAIVQRKLPLKQKDRGSFKIPCIIGTNLFEKVLCDLGSSINLLSLSVAKNIGIGEIKPITVSLQMADKSIAYPEGIIEDLLVKVGKLIFPTDFLVLDIEEDSETHLILGRPFLITARTLIDVEQGVLALRVGEEEAKFKVFEDVKCPREVEDCFHIELIDKVVLKKIEYEDSSNHNSGASEKNKMKEFHNEVHVNLKNHKKRTNKSHVEHIQEEVFFTGQKVILFNPQIFAWKLKSWWSGPFTIMNVIPYDTMEIRHDVKGTKFKVNSHRLKLYIEAHFNHQHAAKMLNNSS
ncbi:uncharacterized protein [Pyrus communis]|uniref:uncharacterized protein n=1 Tax=Pyrus communis TaxID=23211 RepID=UPI0035BED347